MRKVIICLLITLNHFYCSGQNSYIDDDLDSLNKVQPSAYRIEHLRGKAHVIKVQNQQQFDSLGIGLVRAIESGKKNIYVKFGKGTYRFKENHIELKDVNKDISIIIKGKNTVLTSSANIIETENNPWLEMYQMDGLIQVVDKDKKLCMISNPTQWDAETRNAMTRVQVTQWFRAPVYDVERIDDKGIYFIANDLQWEDGYAYKGFNVNFDYLYAGKHPRFRLYDQRRAVTATASCFLRMENTKGVKVEIKGLTFKGNKSGLPLISMSNVRSRQVYIHNCIFDNIHDNVCFFSNVSNVYFHSNQVKNTDGRELNFDNNCKNARITENFFKNCGTLMGNTFCINCAECEYYIANNTFCDIGYGAIGVGVWYGRKKNSLSRGIIEYNEIYFSSTYFAENWKHMLMDSGAIYTCTQNDGVIIRYNYIHDYAGAGDNRGIFCDDGACNLKIYGNVVLNTPTCYSIDSRWSKDQHDGLTNNANNLMAYNVVDGSIRFQGYGDEERNCMKGANFVVKGENMADNKYENLKINVEDIVVQEAREALKYKRLKNFKLKIRNRKKM